MKSVESFGYLGVGANADPDLVEAITGGPPVRVSDVASIANVALYAQGLDEVPNISFTESGPSVRDILRDNYGESFEAYGLRHSNDDIVRGRYFELKAAPLALMRAWDLVEEGWFDWDSAEAIIIPPIRADDGSSIYDVSAMASFIPPNQNVKRRVDGLMHPDFLVDKEKMIEVATRVRLENEA